MDEAHIIEEIKQLIEAAIADVPDEQVMVLMPKINSAMNCYCVDKILALTNMDE